MHKLTRPEEPVELVIARKEQTSNGLNWDGFTCKNHGQDKQIVQETLLLMQKHRCAYCECHVDDHEGHIEHFRRKNVHIHPELTFVWSNLFYSCQQPGDKTSLNRCGISKDKQYTEGFDYSLMIDPCVDNPEDFLVFTPKGMVYPKPGLNDLDKLRAQTTIEMFNLNEHTAGNEHNLVESRRNAIAKFKWLEKRSANEIDNYLNGIRDSEPFVTSIFHYFGKRVVL